MGLKKKKNHSFSRKNTQIQPIISRIIGGTIILIHKGKAVRNTVKTGKILSRAHIDSERERK